MGKAEEYLEKKGFNVGRRKGSLFAVSKEDALEAVSLARKEGYEQAQDDYNIVTERDPSFKELSKIFDKSADVSVGAEKVK